MAETNNLLNVLQDISLNINTLKTDLQDYNIDTQLYNIDTKIYNINTKLIRVFQINSKIIDLKQQLQEKINNN